MESYIGRRSQFLLVLGHEAHPKTTLYGIVFQKIEWAPAYGSGRRRPRCSEAAAEIAIAKRIEAGREAMIEPLLSDEHFSVDGTLIEAWASHKSFRPKDGSGDDDGGADFHGQQRKNDTHASTSDPDSRLYRQGRRAGSKALLHGSRYHGEPPWAGGGRQVPALITANILPLLSPAISFWAIVAYDPA